MVVATLLFLVSGWSLNIATYNWYAADFHNQYSRAYASRGNVFFIVAVVLFAGAISIVVALLRSRKKQSMKTS